MGSRTNIHRHSSNDHSRNNNSHNSNHKYQEVWALVTQVMVGLLATLATPIAMVQATTCTVHRQDHLNTAALLHPEDNTVSQDMAETQWQVAHQTCSDHQPVSTATSSDKAEASVVAAAGSDS